jgi:hypothetical protein
MLLSAQSTAASERPSIVWLLLLLPVTTAESDSQVLLILDNHNSHISKSAVSHVTVYGPLNCAFIGTFVMTRHILKMAPYDLAGGFNKECSQVTWISQKRSSNLTPGEGGEDLNKNSISGFKSQVTHFQQRCRKVTRNSVTENTDITNQQREPQSLWQLRTFVGVLFKLQEVGPRNTAKVLNSSYVKNLTPSSQSLLQGYRV